MKNQQELQEELIIAIAEAAGWTDCRLVIKGAGGGTVYPTAHGKPPNRKYEAPCPRYTADLNAMHEAQKIFKGGMRNVYDTYLNIISERDRCFIWEISAKQKAEAFLHTWHHERN
jgi:hypothetical protein